MKNTRKKTRRSDPVFRLMQAVDQMIAAAKAAERAKKDLLKRAKAKEKS